VEVGHREVEIIHRAVTVRRLGVVDLHLAEAGGHPVVAAARLVVVAADALPDEEALARHLATAPGTATRMRRVRRAGRRAHLRANPRSRKRQLLSWRGLAAT
jgi:hypothetical protein